MTMKLGTKQLFDSLSASPMRTKELNLLLEVYDMVNSITVKNGKCHPDCVDEKNYMFL